MKQILFIAAAAAMTASCTNRNAYTISGTVDGMDGQYVYLSEFSLRPADNLLDSVEVRNGKFLFRGEAAVSQLRLVGSGESENSFVVPVFVEAGDIIVDVEAKTASGTPSNDAARNFKEQEDALDQRYYNSQSAEEREAVIAEFDALKQSLFEANSDNMFGATLLAQQLAYEMTGADILAKIEAFPAEVRNSDLVTELLEQAEAKMVTDPGHPYIEVSQPGMDGKEVTLSSVVENPDNKYVLVDFWASWCGPCMMEVPYLIDAYAEYHDKGFEIYGISHDTDGERWRNCVEDRGMNWIHVSELNRFDNQAAKDYAVRAIPSNFLIETATGKIIATNLRGQAVAEKLAELLD